MQIENGSNGSGGSATGRRHAILFSITLVAISLWTVLAWIVAREWIDNELLTTILALLSVIVFLVFGTIDLAAVPLRRLIHRWAKTPSVWHWRSILTICLLFFGLWEFVGVSYCYYNREKFRVHLKDGWEIHRSPIEAGHKIGLAFAMFPERPEPYVIYNKARQFYKGLPDGAKQLSTFAFNFLYNSNKSTCSYLFSLLFCCSCIEQSKFDHRLLQKIAMVESGHIVDATSTQPSKQSPINADDYLLWLYHKFEVPSVEIDKIMKEIQRVVDDHKYQHRLIYPLLVDRMFQYEYYNAEGDCPTNQLINYTKSFVSHYRSPGGSDVVSPPNKALVYFIIRHAVNFRLEEIPFVKLRDALQNFSEACPEFMTQLTKTYRSQDAEYLYGFEDGYVGELEGLDSVKSYLYTSGNRDWAKLKFLKR